MRLREKQNDRYARREAVIQSGKQTHVVALSSHDVIYFCGMPFRSYFTYDFLGIVYVVGYGRYVAYIRDSLFSIALPAVLSRLRF